MAAKGRQAGDDRVADLHRAHFAADRLDDARGFMAGDRGEGVRIGAVDEMQIRMAKPARDGADTHLVRVRSEEHTSELQSLMCISYAVFCLKKKKSEITNESY